MGTLKDHKVYIYLDKQAQPQFLKTRPLLLLLRDKVAEELDRLQPSGIIAPTKFSKWATPIIPVIKSERSISICGDFNRTINKLARTEVYPLPQINELLLACQVGRPSPS